MIKESIGSKIGRITRSVSDTKTIISKWNDKSKKSGRFDHYINDNLSDEEFMEFNRLYKTISTCKSFSEYKKAFDTICRKCGRPTEHITIITVHGHKRKNEKDKNTIDVNFASCTNRVTIQKDAVLYHKTTDPHLPSLQPFFRSRSGKDCFYSRPRVYFSIHKNITRLIAGIRSMKDITTPPVFYTPKENIRTLMVDPEWSHFAYGAGYVETESPIPVEKVTSKKYEETEKNEGEEK